MAGLAGVPGGLVNIANNRDSPFDLFFVTQMICFLPCYFRDYLPTARICKTFPSPPSVLFRHGECFDAIFGSDALFSRT